MNPDRALRASLNLELSPHWQRLHGAALDELHRGCRNWLRQNPHRATESLESLLRYLPIALRQAAARLSTLHSGAQDFSARHTRAVLAEERRQHLLAFAKLLGANERRLSGDARALDRWFGPDAIAERYQNRVAEQERLIALCLERFGVLSAQLLAQRPETAQRAWDELKIGETLCERLNFKGQEQVRLMAFQALDKALKQLPADARMEALGHAALQFALRVALDAHGSVWLQCAALEVLSSVSVAYFCRAVRRRFRVTAGPDDLFVRARAVAIMARLYSAAEEMPVLIQAAASDPSAHVRQAVAAVLSSLPPEQVYSLLAQLTQDADASVRAASLITLPELIRHPQLRPVCGALLVLILKRDSNPFVVRVGLRAAVQTQARLFALADPAGARKWDLALAGTIDELHSRHQQIRVRRWAAETRERLWCQRSQQRRQALEDLQAGLRDCPSGQIRVFELPADLEARELARILAVCAQDGAGYELERSGRRVRIRKHGRFGWRLWRVLHETFHVATDKRQGFRHTVGRLYSSHDQAPSGIMAEASETKVPGEPLYLSEEGGWRPYLPLLDQVISACAWTAAPTRLHSAEGITLIRPPERLWQRIAARSYLSRHFARLARLRNWKSTSHQPSYAYVAALNRLGIGIEFTPHADELNPAPAAPDPSIKRFFAPAGTSLVLVPPGLFEDFSRYFVSVYQNSLRDLIVFMLGLSVVVFGRHLLSNYRMHRYRQAIPLVIGGWGTRGKSGTERLKAALFNALGFNFVSKTTGCEAMFVHAPAYGQAREMFLFRPYDKASIWEQIEVMRIARDLGCEVFLWECMALTPSFVHTLQREWMHDDISTITNAYPDHEDLQGPAGINIPQVMGHFIPTHSCLISTEEQMAPVLEEEARRVNTTYHRAGWLEAGLIPPDILARFPYEEHANNMALVIGMAAQLGIERDFVLKEMADRVIPDLGVLKAYPVARRHQRRLEFIMGMSANERLGTLNNWQRMGFGVDAGPPKPGIWTSTLVNNRADRVARSQVFASILVNDIQAHRHVLIGSNLDGLQTYLREAWNQRAKELQLWPDSNEAPAPTAILEAEARTRRVPTSRDEVCETLNAMLDGVDAGTLRDQSETWLSDPERLLTALEGSAGADQADAIVRVLREQLQAWQEYAKFHQRIEQAEPSAELEQAFGQLCWHWFQNQLIVIDDPHASGAQIVQRLYDATPPGHLNRVMGMQNIKGTGLDFVYAWQAWDACARACAGLLSLCWDEADADLQALLLPYRPASYRKESAAAAEAGLRSLAGFQEYNLLCEETLRAVVATVRASVAAQSELFQAELNVIEQALSAQLAEQELGASRGQSPGALNTVLSFIESALDAGDAVARRRRANQIYRDLGQERIGSARAALELQNLTKRQKGGWFTAKAGARIDAALASLRALLRRGDA